MLIDADRQRLDGKPRALAATMMLTGEAGPLSPALGAFDAPTAGLAYLIWMARQRSRAAGILKGRPGYEADETLRNRVLAAAEASLCLRDFATRIYDRLGVSLAALRPVDLLWWRDYHALTTGRWQTLSEEPSLVETLTAVALLGDLIRELNDPAASGEELKK